MAKKEKQAGAAIPNRQTFTRVSFLYQAATYLAASAPTPSQPAQSAESVQASQALSRRLVDHLQSVSRKNVIRISSDIKRSLCKNCDTVLIEGKTCTSNVENKSTGGLKSWADVLVIKCTTCSKERRFPVSATRQKRKAMRDVTAESCKKADETLQRTAPG